MYGLDIKPTNPKDAIGAGKLPLQLVPGAFKAYTALGLAEGGFKYGIANFRATGVRLSIYLAALERHMLKFTNGEWADKNTGVPHLANACACLAIIIDAHTSGVLIDDRPPAQPQLSALIDDFATNIDFLKTLFADQNPKHWTIDDELPR